MKQELLDLVSLRAMKVNAESGRLALHAASIVVHAHAIARDRPDRSDDARRIIGLTRRLYTIMPSREILGGMVDELLADIATAQRDGRSRARARDRFVERVWHHFQHGQDRDMDR